MGLAQKAIMAELFKCTWAVRYGRGGFSFSHFIQKDSYSDALLAAGTLAEKYLACCGRDVLIHYIRASRNDIRGDSQILAKTYGSVGAPDPAEETDVQVRVALDDTADAWWTAALLRIGSSPTAVGHQFMRGIPDSLIILPGGIVNHVDWGKAIQKYFNQLKLEGWGMLAVPRGAGYQKQVKGYAAGAVAGSVIIETVVPHGITAGQKFRIQGLKPGVSSASPNGQWIADAVPDPTHITVLTPQAMTFPAVIKNYGLLWSLEKTFAAYSLDQCNVVRVTERHAGRPSDVLVGRRRRKK